MNRKGGVPIDTDRAPSKSEICARNQRDGRKSKGSLFGAESQLQGEVDGGWAACVVAHGDDLVEPLSSRTTSSGLNTV